MQLLVPYRTLHPDTDAALTAHAPGAVRHRLGPELDAYHWWWADRWDWACLRGRGLSIVEQDIVIGPDVVPGFAACREPWCVHPYPGPGGRLLTESLGCVRWSVDLIAAEPDLPVAVAQIDDGDGIGPRDWRRLDVRVAGELRRRGHTVHVHAPPVGHRHHYDPPNGPCHCGACPAP